MELQLNGKRLIVTPAGFADAMELQGAVAEALKGSKLNLAGIDLGGGVAGVLESDLSDVSGPLESLAGMVLGVVTSKRVENALFKCAEKVLWGDDKVNRDFFEPVDNRELYYPIMVEVVKANVGPFFRKLGSMFGEAGGLLSSFLKSKST